MEEKKLPNLKSLLSQVSVISKKYEEIAQITGENYNVFNILGLSTREVRTHSAFIADLLNPKGLHGKGAVFLELFKNELNKKVKINTDLISEESKVIVEENIGKISGDEGGRIDIVIKDNKGQQIVIENKIYARDQFKQLVRYHEKYPNALLLYLTLEEKEASEDSVKKENGTSLKVDVEYFNITYKNEIIKWLKECHKETANHPLLRETLTQYINLIKQLTGQTMNDNMNKEIAGEIIEGNNFENAMAIVNGLNSAKNELKNWLDNALEKISELDKELSYKKGTGWFLLQSAKEPNAKIGLTIEGGHAYLGIVRNEKQNDKLVPKEIQEKLDKSNIQWKVTNWWYAQKRQEKYLNVENNLDFWNDLKKGIVFDEIIKLLKYFYEDLDEKKIQNIKDEFILKKK